MRSNNGKGDRRTAGDANAPTFPDPFPPHSTPLSAILPPAAAQLRAYDWLFCHWLPASGEEAGDAPVYEEYLNDGRSLPPEQWQTAICLPLKSSAKMLASSGVVSRSRLASLLQEAVRLAPQPL
ncbi:GyrI-like domain-containing protein [Lysobacter enzymogenes]|uniref:GyrI-like domain-containing protein n=1 Tax=Lysobacter enzymogenes TaxID=69 RepID=UPI00384D673E